MLIVTKYAVKKREIGEYDFIYLPKGSIPIGYIEETKPIGIEHRRDGVIRTAEFNRYVIYLTVIEEDIEVEVTM